MKPNPITACIFMMISSTFLAAQEPAAKKEKRKLTHIGVTFTNSHTAMPFGHFSKLVTGNYHPGFEVSTGFNWKVKPKHDWIQAFNAGYSFHRYVQHSIVLYTEFGYRYKFPAGFFAEAKLGGGYMRAILAADTFSDGVDDGMQYSKISAGRTQGIATLSFAASKKITRPFECKFLLEYQQRMQTPFIPSYVPLLPYNILKFGISFPIRKHNPKTN